uniref:Putative DNA polymerase III, epsilon subunit n=1 Tax=Paulinella longichromatophora TaxID=1708747 RepID=A0A2H4ZNP8_9EUKA|nr:putative DNA polymerase III, epsilon subunit [Paulinella longichromatophora]
MNKRIEFPCTAELIALPELLLIVSTKASDNGNGIETGAILFDLPHRTSIAQVAFTLHCECNLNPSNKSYIISCGKAGLTYFSTLVENADLIISHNITSIGHWFDTNSFLSINKPWICTMRDISWPIQKRLQSNPSIYDLALAYHVPVWSTNRPLIDCLYLSQVFERCPELETLIQNSLEPRQNYRAQASQEENKLVQESGFTWDPLKGIWSRHLSAKEVISLPFPVYPISD